MNQDYTDIIQQVSQVLLQAIEDKAFGGSWLIVHCSWQKIGNEQQTNPNSPTVRMPTTGLAI